MLFRNGGQLAPKSLRRKNSIAARGFFDVLWRWSRIGCEASQSRRYGANTLRAGFRAQQSHLLGSRSRLPNTLLRRTGQKHRSNSLLISSNPNREDSPAEGKGHMKETPPLPWDEGPTSESASSSIPAVDTGIQSSSAAGKEQSEEPLSQSVIDKLQQSRQKKEKGAPEGGVTQNQPLPPLSYKLRSIMRALPSPVVVLTATNTGFAPKPQLLPPKSFRPIAKTKTARGMTISSFASVTLSPEPIITFNVRCPSSTLQAIVRNKQFLIHILDASQKGAKIANVFTKSNGEAQYPTAGRAFELGRQESLFKIGPHMVTSDENTGEEKFIVLPRLEGEGIGKVLRCELIEGPPHGESNKVKGDIGLYGQLKPPSGLVAVGDHVLVLARVIEIVQPTESKGGKYGLMYADGKYRWLGQPFSDTTEKTKLEKIRKVLVDR